MLILTLPREQNGHPIGCITSLLIISPVKPGVWHLQRLIIYGLITMAMLVEPLIDVKDSGKVRNWRVAKMRIVLIPLLILIRTFISLQLIHECRYQSINNTNELHLLVSICFWVKKESMGGQISSKKHCIQVRTSVFVSSPQPLHHTDKWIASFYIALIKSRNYGNYVHMYVYIRSEYLVKVNLV